ncbi:hypothetical protein Q9252_15385 [Marinobacter salarius]|uniref:hypothetical protein n=1 Tax=Marinobacter salarius TaxID=1420917 RepID=UPI00273CC00B|nr:hypothetical protein [Marinobacter salarius]MDP4533527.1 hypothetical protein [Marinobacter salarius]
MKLPDHIYWLDLPPFDGDRIHEGRLTCYRSNPQQIDATAIMLTELMEHKCSSVSVMSMLRTHHEEMLRQFQNTNSLQEAAPKSAVNFCYAGGTCHSADTLIVLPVMATGTQYEPLINEIRDRSADLFDVLEQQEFERVIVLGEKLAWLSIGGFFARWLAEISSTDYPVSEWYFKHDIRDAVDALFGDGR